jgi:NTP pyrophosphatase (non-canonical NTP hydrolase)
MKWSEYIEAAMRTAPHESKKEMLVHAALGICGEVGELFDLVISQTAHDEGTKKQVADEMGDVLWYCALASESVCVDELDTQKPSDDNWHQVNDVFLSLMREASRFAEMTKKHVIHYKDREREIVKSLKCVIAQCILICKLMDIDIDDVLAWNIDKLKARYPDGFAF